MACFRFFTLLLLLLTAEVVAQINTSQLDELFTRLEAEGEFNGTVMVAKAGEVLYKANLGFADFDNRIPVNDSTVFELASAGKQFTAMGILLLREAGQLDYDHSLQRYFPALPYPGVTIRHLLTMTSGLPDYLTFADSFDAEAIYTNADVLAYYVATQPDPLFPPGDRFAYANINYVLLAEIIRLVAKRPFAEFLRENIFLPLGMKHTRSYTSRFSENETLPNYAYPYVKREDGYRKTSDNEATKYVIATSGIEGDGSIVSTAPDLLKWTLALEQNTLVTEETLSEAYTNYTLNDGTKSEYGFGIYRDKNKAWHWGGWPGIQTAYTRYLDRGLVVFYLKNVESRSWAWLSRFNRIIE